jgi:hypothetical protein
MIQIGKKLLGFRNMQEKFEDIYIVYHHEMANL